jgi:O-antigen/teichoic acid export membrane protein
MFRNILSTTVSRLFNAILALAILLMTTNQLGREGMGTIGLISNYIGGGALIFLAPRHRQMSLFFPSYLWAVLVAFTGTLILTVTNLIPAGFTVDVLLLSLLQSFMSINTNLMIGREKIRAFNLISVLQVVVTALTLYYFLYIIDVQEVRSYVYALYSGFGIGFLLSLIMIWRTPGSRGELVNGKMIREILRYGKYIQTANVLQLLNYRLSYYLIEIFSGRASLGLYNVGVQLSEGVWLAGKSVATVQYARISNMSDRRQAVQLTLLLLRFTLLISLLLVLLLALLPDSLYVAVFGQDFYGVRKVILSLSAGILANAVAMILSHYFSGTGRPVHNMTGSMAGLLVTLVLGLIFIPRYGVIAAGVTASLSYMVNLIYLLVIFIRTEKPGLADFCVRKSDLVLIRQLLLTRR